MEEYSNGVQDLAKEVDQYQDVIFYGLIAVAVLLAAWFVFRVVRWLGRPRKGTAALHPKLQKYAGRSDAEIEADRLDSEKIIATSSTDSVAGYELVQQIEAVFVEGCRSQQEATLALKAAAGRCGGNAIINVAQQRSTAGKCGAQGDAVVIKPRFVEPPRANRRR